VTLDGKLWNSPKRPNKRVMEYFPWCIIGDFNDIFSNDDKRGRVQHPQWLFNGFREVVNDYGLIDMPMKGHAHTWSRRMGSNNVVEERLDRALVTNSWMAVFHQCLLQNLVTGASELRTEQKLYEFKKGQFRFENSWLVELELDSVVHDGWFHDVNEP